MAEHLSLTKGLLRYKSDRFRIETVNVESREGFDRAGDSAESVVIQVSGRRGTKLSLQEGVGEVLPPSSLRESDVATAVSSLNLAREWTLGEFFDRTRESPFGGTTMGWALEMAGFDLALRQLYLGFSSILLEAPGAVRFVVSPPAHPEPVGILREYLAADPTLEFRLKPSPDWGEEVWAALAEASEVKMIVLDGFVEMSREDPAALGRLAGLLSRRPEVLLENPEAPVWDALQGLANGICWNKGFSSTDDIGRYARPGDYVCLKPSLFGGLDSFAEAVDFCEEAGLLICGGDQGEVGPTRTQHQAIAASLYPQGPNDLARYEYYLRPYPVGEGNPIEPTYHTKHGVRFREREDTDPWFKGLHAEDRIRERREKLGLALDEVAAKLRMDPRIYRDIEEVEEDFFYLRLKDAKELARTLGLDLFEVSGLRCSLCAGLDVPRMWLTRPRHELARLRRLELGLTVGEVAERIRRYELRMTKGVESDPAFLEEEASIDFVVELARVLQLPPDLLAGLQCSRCDAEGSRME